MSYKDIDFENDCIAWVCHFGKGMRNRYITDGFFKTAELIYDAAKNGKRSGIYEDDLVYPFLHLIRHGYELRLKMIMDDIKTFLESYAPEKLDNEKFKQCVYSHDIGEIYAFIKDHIFKLDDRFDSLLCETIETMGRRISDFLPEKDIDPYRYATDRDGNENLSGLNQVSFDKAIADAQDFESATDYALFCLSELFDEYSLGTHYKTLSRHNLFQIATELPKYEKWCEPSFDTIRENIKTKYRISGCTLGQAIKIIQNSNELSFYIGYHRKNYEHEIATLKRCFDFNQEIKTINEEGPVSIDDYLCDSYDRIAEYRTKCHEFLRTLSDEDMILVLTYYLMGREQKRSEQFSETMETAKSCGDPNDSYALESYLRGKLTSHLFIGNVLNGTRASGDFELFIELYDYCKANNKIELSEWEKEYERVKKYL